MIEKLKLRKASNGFQLEIDDSDFTLTENLNTYTEVLDRVDDYIKSERDEELISLDKLKPGASVGLSEAEKIKAGIPI